MVAELIGGIFAAGLVEILLPGDLSVDTTINYASGITTVQALFLEAFLTFELTLAIFMLAFEKVIPYHSAASLSLTFPPPANYNISSIEQHPWHHSALVLHSSSFI